MSNDTASELQGDFSRMGAKERAKAKARAREEMVSQRRANHQHDGSIGVAPREARLSRVTQTHRHVASLVGGRTLCSRLNRTHALALLKSQALPRGRSTYTHTRTNRPLRANKVLSVCFLSAGKDNDGVILRRMAGEGSKWDAETQSRRSVTGVEQGFDLELKVGDKESIFFSGVLIHQININKYKNKNE